MTAMCAENRVLRCEMRTNTARDRFLTNIGMAGSMNQPALMTSRQFLFRLTNDHHRAEQRENLLVSHAKLSTAGSGWQGKQDPAKCTGSHRTRNDCSRVD